MEKYVIIEFDLTNNAVLGYLATLGGYNAVSDLSTDINNALTFDTRDEVRYELGVMLKDRPAREFRYRAVTQSLVLVP
ncbi:MAG: hypothetical protein JGK21_30335 [Microcoleus sp. PH2017_22_RUC_O_B]|uniref:hypothetical protein n=1 Tax=unclassified Microcoleus TaxID=2642155 RepID=UPI001D897A16|nr:MULTISPECIES: hypothetical protein [unclassified Microcoleus]MCC3532261.1 hypothetical protein [Microcoleus sp. PH2017_21_RUC_O_A]MCC3544548.1 hypothetical protein [Microcoleus sp. PH2017_22_RUC_O_B]